ncbi:hypothetical protein [Glycomyces paridis]|uniref:hypothetical protein n=1 Tax=Glycomyces paridis TaxID=2126555 RepID=UPI0019561299|nr:hypothetical protein [Glycomyces paridis]
MTDDWDGDEAGDDPAFGEDFFASLGPDTPDGAADLEGVDADSTSDFDSDFGLDSDFETDETAPGADEFLYEVEGDGSFETDSADYDDPAPDLDDTP